MNSRGLSVLESKELRRRAIMDEDLEADEFDYNLGQRKIHESQGDLTMEMLSGAMPKKALESIQESYQHPGESQLTVQQSDITMSNPLQQLNYKNSLDNNLNQNKFKLTQMNNNKPTNQGFQQYGFDDDFSVEQFKKNNAQLQEILMQLTTPQFDQTTSDTIQRIGRPTVQSQQNSKHQSSSSTSKFNNHLISSNSGDASAQTHKTSDLRDQNAIESQNLEVSQFSYKDMQNGLQNDDGAKSYLKNQPSSNQLNTAYQNMQQEQSKIQMLQSAIANQKAQFLQQQQIPQSSEGSNYWKNFQPQMNQELPQQYSQQSQRPNAHSNIMHNPTFQNAAQTILDQKENFNGKNFQVEFEQRRLQSVENKYQNQESMNKYNQHSSYPSQQLQQAQDFTLQPRQQQDPNNQQSQKPNMFYPLSNQYKETMKNFDDIPISKIQKMAGYQTHPIDYEGNEDVDPVLPVKEEVVDEEIDISHLPLAERVIHANWRVRLDSYKEINQLFYSDYAKFENSKGNDSDVMASFDIYGPLLQEMVKDTNSVAAYEALLCLHSYVRFATSIKSVSFATHNLLLEKLQTNKPNFKEITTKILLTMLRREQTSMIYPELIKRFKNKNSKTAIFALYVVNEAFKCNTGVEDMNLKATFKAIQEVFNHNSLPLRELSYQILQHIYRNCGDEASKIISFCKNLRPIQIKELNEQLQKIEKNPKFSKSILIDQTMADEDSNAQTFKEGKEIESLKLDQKVNSFDAEKTMGFKDKNNTTQTSEQIDLLSLAPENYSDLPYITQINAKKKVMEQFNIELAKLVGRKQLQIKNKDYTIIFNTGVHMLEDKNMLVYLEAIRNVELLSMLLGTQIKQIKVKQFINLIATKYGEQKTAVINAVDKGLLAIVKHSYTPILFAQQCIGEIASTHKNPKVKQMVIEHALDQLLLSLEKDQTHVVAMIFKNVKEKLMTLVLKDTNANVRDACVQLLTTFKTILPEDQTVQDAINQLPKYRVSEIAKKISDANQLQNQEEYQDENVPTKQEYVEEPVNDKPHFSKTLNQKLANIKKAQQAVPDTSLVIKQVTFSQALIREARKGQGLSPNFSQYVKTILENFEKFMENDFSIRYDILEHQWNEILLKLGEPGLQESRSVLIKGVHKLILTPQIAFADHQNHFRSILAFVKRLFVLQRSIEREDDGTSEELTQYIRISLLQNQWIPGNQKETCQMLSVAMHATNNAFEFNERLRDVVDEPIMLLSTAALQIIEAVYVWLGTNLNMFMARGLLIEDIEELRGFGIKFLEGANFTENQRQALVSIMIKFKDLVSFQRLEIEKMQQVHKIQATPDQVIKEEDETEFPEKRALSRQATPQIQNHVNIQEIDQNQVSQASTTGGKINLNQNCRLVAALPSTAAFRKDSICESDGDEIPQSYQTEESKEYSNEKEQTMNKNLSAEYICSMIDKEFEKGLLLFKELAQNEPSISFETKKQIFEKLLSIVSEGFKASQQQQYKQAYALKALMWMKEETLGVEDCFKLTQRVMLIYSTSDLEGNDSTVELYLLNFWTKELSYRDLCDRILLCVLNYGEQNDANKTNLSSFTNKQSSEIDQSQIELFNCLFSWFSKTRLFPEKKSEIDEEWEIQDLRKIAFPLIYSLLDRKSDRQQVSKDFIKHVSEKLGQSKIKEFVEVQLIHKPELYQRFLDWFEIAIVKPRVISAESKKSVPRVQIDKLTSSCSLAQSDIYSNEKLSSQSSQSQLKQPASNTPRGQNDNVIQSYKERRDQHKSKISGRQESNVEKDTNHSKQYEDIISKIEHNLQVVKQVTKNVISRDSKKIDETSRESDEEEIEDEQIKEEVEPLRKTNTSVFYQNVDKVQRYQAIADSPRSQDETDRLQPQLIRAEVLRDNLEMSELKSKHWMDKIRILEEEKQRIENQSEILQKEKNEQSDLWRSKVASMENEHKKVIKNLNEMNDQYSRQLDENQQLKMQLNKMQQQHVEMMNRFEEIEKRINAPKSPQQKEPQIVQKTPDRDYSLALSPRKDFIVSVKKLQRIENTFAVNGDVVSASQELFVIQKIQDLLLSVEKNVEGELSQPLIYHYQKLKSANERMSMISAVKEALDENEDVLMALSVDVYKAMLNFLLRAFSFEKQVLERQSMEKQGQDQNEITLESQRMVSKLLNSKEFTVSLVCLFQLLREAMPDNLSVQLTIEQRQYLRVIMRCIQRITKALHSEQPDLVRGFDVLLEMQKMFVKHPPEQLREDLPCLSDFDFIYRGMKDVSDKMIDLQPEKVQSFLSFSAEQPQNAFIKYLRSVTASQY